MTIAIFYATREGHTRRVADHLASALRKLGLTVDLFDVADGADDIDFGQYTVAIVAASIHIGRHEREMIAFVKRNREWLDRIPSAFLSVSLSQAGAEDPARTDAERARSARDVNGTLEGFIRETGWRPPRVMPVAGALAYTKYNPLVRLVMRWIARRERGATDTSRDHVYTDWGALDRLADEIAGPSCHASA